MKVQDAPLRLALAGSTPWPLVQGRSSGAA